MDCAEFFAAKAARSTSYPLARFTVIELPQQAGMQPRASELPELPRFAFGALYATRSPRKSFDSIQPFCLNFFRLPRVTCADSRRISQHDDGYVFRRLPGTLQMKNSRNLYYFSLSSYPRIRKIFQKSDNISEIVENLTGRR